MGFTLESESGQDLRLNRESWRCVLAEAYHHGWRPAGTTDPCVSRMEGGGKEPRNQNVGYFANEGQLVTTPDARALSVALEAARQRHIAEAGRAASSDDAWEWTDNREFRHVRAEHLAIVGRFSARGAFRIF